MPNSPYTPKSYVELNHPEWSKNAVIYEVNIRQYTPEGTFKAFAKHLPRLKDLGVDILWLMPIHPIGKKNRKGSLGSYYAVSDYYGVNPEFGTMDDFTLLVQQIHEMGMYVIMDWVANHSAWDHPLTKEHPEWYTKTIDGDFRPTPWYDWDDIIDFDYSQPGLRKYMTDAIKYWVEEAGVDGYRCDVAGFVPIDFWEHVRRKLESIKPVFMLAEWESRDLHRRAFDMTYAWSLWFALEDLFQEQKGLHSLLEYLAHDVSTFPDNAFRMTFTENHDKNSWEGNQYANYGEGLHAAMVLCCTINGMPLVYSGQEAGLDRSLKFFEKDEIDWRDHENTGIYRKLFQLKKKNRALWNGKWGGEMIRIKHDQPDQVLSFYRESEGDKIISVINLSDQDLDVNLDTIAFTGSYKEVFTNEKLTIKQQTEFQLKPWSYKVLSNR
ncbi:MAG: alpha-amylase [Bacteroidetes bacterium]|jgi:glycosidase|nr:alpha-amylase [Bacteroidota bacterium]